MHIATKWDLLTNHICAEQMNHFMFFFTCQLCPFILTMMVPPSLIISKLTNFLILSLMNHIARTRKTGLMHRLRRWLSSLKDCKRRQWQLRYVGNPLQQCLTPFDTTAFTETILDRVSYCWTSHIGKHSSLKGQTGLWWWHASRAWWWCNFAHAPASNWVRATYC